MELVTKHRVDLYLKGDVTSQRLDEFSDQHEEEYTCQKWLRDSPAKRYIYEVLYGSLFESTTGQRVLDVGGGLTGLTPILARNHDYTLADILAHDHIEEVERLSLGVGRDFVMAQDWANLDESHYDVVIANDIFPNVDQRIEWFLEKFIPQSKRIKMLLTWYNEPRQYMVRRIDGEEIFCILAWNKGQLVGVLEKFRSRIQNPNFELFEESAEPVFPNGRQTCIVEIQGDL